TQYLIRCSRESSVPVVIVFNHFIEFRKSHWVKYCSVAIEDATEIASRITGLMGSYGFGFAKKRLVVEAVYE
ncbi:hypothetical protein ACFLSH_00745, partial [Bacteroidota bacterium]